MPILPQNTDPLQDYVSSNVKPALTTDGIVYNKIYAHTGVIDSLNNTTVSNYAEPNFNTTNGSNGLLSFNPKTATYWISYTDFGGPTSTPIVLTYNLSNTTFYNSIALSVLNVPCLVELLDDNLVALPGQSVFTIAGGSDLFTTTDWVYLEYNAPTNISSINITNGTSFTYPLTGANNINVRITRNKVVQTTNVQNVLSNAAYSVGLKNFKIKLNVQSTNDVPTTVLSGTSSMIVQNRLGFVENYNFAHNPTSNMFLSASGNSYWKSQPQPVKDSIVYFYAKLSDPTATLINRLYIDPLYSGCRFNLYFTTQTASGNTIDPGTFTWTPINADFTLRKGIYEIPRTSATYLKFEFTQLIPEVYDLPFDSINRTINVFPPDVEQYYYNLEQSIVDGNAVKYSTVGNSNIGTLALGNQNINQPTSSTVFGLSNTTVGNNSWPSIAALNNNQAGTSLNGLASTSQILDPSLSYKLLDANGTYNQNSYTDFLYRRFPNARTHSYNQVTINQTWHQAYFTGIRYIEAFYENVYDDLRGIPGNLISRVGTTSGFVAQDDNYVQLNPDDTATTPWFDTIDKFSSFNIGGLTTDWRSFLTQGNLIANDPTLLNGLTASTISGQMIAGLNSTMTITGTLGLSTIYSIAPSTSNVSYGVQSPSYAAGNNIMNYYDANFLSLTNWVAGSGTTVTSTKVTWSGYSGSSTSATSGVASGITVSGGTNTVTYNFTIPSVLYATGEQAWTTQLGSASLGVVGYVSYSPVLGTNYYFLTNLQSSGTTNVTMTTKFIDPTTGSGYANTTVTGSVVNLTAASGYGIITATGTNYTGSVPSNTIQLTLSGSAAGVPYQVYQAGIFNNPTNVWISPTDRSNMRVSGVARMFLPNTNIGSYRVSLYALNSAGSTSEIAFKTYTANQLPLNSWFDIQLQGFTSTNYLSFFVRVVQTDTSVNEKFYIGMLAPFYHPVRYEYRNTISGAYQPITIGINDPNSFITTVSGLTASGIQVRMTALDPNIYVAGVSIVPQYDQSPYYSNLNIDYLGNSKTNEVPSRSNIDSKPYFQLNKNVYPSKFNLSNVAGTIIPYAVD